MWYYLGNGSRQRRCYYRSKINVFEWPSRSFTYRKFFQMGFFAELWRIWHDFIWHSASLVPSAIAKPLFNFERSFWRTTSSALLAAFLSHDDVNFCSTLTKNKYDDDYELLYSVICLQKCCVLINLNGIFAPLAVVDSTCDSNGVCL